MQSCLGLYIEDNLIKYAKVSKNNDNIKVESFGIKFYETINTAIKQIVEETYSFKLPININSSEEWYNDIEVFSLLAKKDMDSAIKTEFESICYGKDVNKNIYEQRYVFSNAHKSNDKINVIHIAVPKTSIEQRKNQLSEYKVNNITPISLSIANLIKKEKKGTSLIVNIEKDTTITRVTGGAVSDIQILNVGAQEILDKINKKENSYAKAYEICKSATIYTETDKDLQYEENEYLEDIMPTLFQIVSQVRKNIDESIEKVDKVYITGTGAIINNIDIYFQDNLRDIHCEILKPSFINNNSKINIKDYIEVNSAISIALQGLEKNAQSINFKNETGVEKLKTILNSNILDINIKDVSFSKSNENFLDKFKRTFSISSISLVMITILYIAGAIIVDKQIDKKIEEANLSISNTNAKIEQIRQYNKSYNSKTTEYQTLIAEIQALNDANSEDKRYKNTIPNLLNNIMVVIPKNVQLISIANTSDTHVVINAKSKNYEQIAYFKTKIMTEGILKNVVSNPGVSQNGYLNVTIEGELP